MADSSGHLCPECGAPRGADNTPSCGCARRASDALRDARTAEQAAAEDFDPLRIRPYVELDSRAHPAEPLEADATMALRTVAAPGPDLSPFESAEPETAVLAASPVLTGDEESRGPARRRTVLLGSVAALVAVVAAAGLASGLLSYDSPERDGALPEEVRASVPDASTGPASSAPASASASASASPSVSADASESTSASPSASPSPSASSASPSAGTSVQPSASASATGGNPVAGPDGSGTSDGSDDPDETTPPVLRRGSSGPEVVELELRLTQLRLYDRKASGHYNEGVEDAVRRYQYWLGLRVDEYGVYDLTTRASLEANTYEP
ncbi:peptidoglycan-binding domain-containing protein [Streptomyces sp. NPDC090106]|uniref:peptidoglycan-binding domain-containing protein n=1 Tax=Streptomyces sp. NPDC090106 TaxID=3365946 RepID=UPI00380FCB34